MSADRAKKIERGIAKLVGAQVDSSPPAAAPPPSDKRFGARPHGEGRSWRANEQERGARLRERREALGLTVEAVAKAMSKPHLAPRIAQVEEHGGAADFLDKIERAIEALAATRVPAIESSIAPPASVGVAKPPKIAPSTRNTMRSGRNTALRELSLSAQSPRSSTGSAGARDGCSQARTKM